MYSLFNWFRSHPQDAHVSASPTTSKQVVTQPLAQPQDAHVTVSPVTTELVATQPPTPPRDAPVSAVVNEPIVAQSYDEHICVSSATNDQVTTQPQNVHILTDEQYNALLTDRATIMEKLHELSAIIVALQNGQVIPPSMGESKPMSHTTPDAFQSELFKKLKNMRLNMGASHGFTPEEIMELNKSICH